VSGRRLAGSWLIGLGAGLITLALVRGNLGSLGFPFALSAAGLFLLTRSGQSSQHFPDTELERGLDRLFALLLPARKATTTASARIAMTQQRRLAVLRRGARRWGAELQLIATDGYETASRISALSEHAGEQDDRMLVAEAVHVLGVERVRAGADRTLADDPVSMLAYGLGARPVGTDLTSLEDLLCDLGLSEEGDELRTHFDEVLARGTVTTLRLRDDAERSMFRDLAGASFVLGAAARILELASLSPPIDRSTPAAAAGAT
jgi:hypothetical protein